MPDPLSSIKVVLVANRGEVVSRVARTAARLGLRTVGVYAESDATNPYIRDVDMAIALGDDDTTSPYLDIDGIISAAVRSGADAVHPGYGFLAENAQFAEACIKQGLTWIGPSPLAMSAMGGKIRAKEIAREAGVPVLDSVEILDGLGEVRALAERAGFPLLVKPSAGGGGKGMHRVDSLDELEETVLRAQREARAAFGDSALLVERLIERPRHVEVQVFGDQHGNVVHLGDRDCSIQRRHQKLVEEAPAPRLAPQVRRQLAESSVALAKQIGYSGAGTVEFLCFDDQIAFLEMNTRLQVEHAVTEEVTGLDLVELQLRVADGQALPFSQAEVVLTGHAIEVRLCAEDPARDYLPSPGVVRELELRAGSTARWELGVRSGSRVSTRYDPMIAKAIAVASSRDGAAAQLAQELSGLRLHGIATNRELLAAVMTSAGFLEDVPTTSFLEENPRLATPAYAAGVTELHAIAAAIHQALAEQETKQVQRFAPYGWRNFHSQDQEVHLRCRDGEVHVLFRQERTGEWRVRVSDVSHRIRVFNWDRRSIDIELSGQRQELRVAAYPDLTIVEGSTGQTRFTPVESLGRLLETPRTGSCLAPVPGSVTDVRVEAGQVVERGEVMVIIEAMKMEHRIMADAAGVVESVRVTVGDSVDYQDVLVVFGPTAGVALP
jgi:propionyl-CoA carboxylase alpha chain